MIIMAMDNIYDKYFKNSELSVDDLMKASGRNP